MKLIDIGVNILNPTYDKDRGEIISLAREAGVSPLIISSSTEGECIKAALYAEKYNAEEPGSLYIKAGVHPHETRNCNNNTLDCLRDLIKEKGELIKAIGECGLDYNRDFSPRDIQRKWFRKQAELASEFSLPLFIHERDAHDDLIIILNDHISSVPAVVIHCFTGNRDQLERYLSLGFYIGITGWISDPKRGKELRELVKIIPSDRLMIESDGPYLLPGNIPFKVKNKRNEPKFLPYILDTIAELLGKDNEVLAGETYKNSLRFFGIGENNGKR